MLDDYIVEESITRHGIVGSIAPKLKPDIRKWTLQARYISSRDSARICSVLAD